MSIQLKFIGGVRTVTGSMHLLSVGRSRVLIDCGLFQGRREEFFKINAKFPFEPASIDAAIISHAHIDHCGNFPTLVQKGFRSKAYLTTSTRELCWYMLPDSGHVQEDDIKYLNKINRRKGLPARNPLYTQSDAEQSLKFLKKLEYHKKISVTKDIDLTFYDSGHILGSSIPVLDIATGNGFVRLAYAVDLGRQNLPYLHNPEVPKGIDYLIIESTYGGRKRPGIGDAEEKLKEAVLKTVKRGGKIIIPSFALERTQELLYFLARLLKHRKIKDIPIFVDSPLAVHITQVFRDSWDMFDEETRQIFSRGRELFDNKNITYIVDVEQSKKLHAQEGPLIIISASGMCENGRVLHHLKNNIENPKNTILIVGYMAPNTLGRKIIDRQPVVNIFGRPYHVKAEIIALDSFSSHADHRDLIAYVRACRGQLKQVFVVHGEPEQSDKFKESIRSLGVRVSIPVPGEEAIL